jgi:diacylglycerol kinase family enzyme
MRFLVVINKDSGTSAESTELKKINIEQVFRQYHESAEIDVKVLQECDIIKEIESNKERNYNSVIAAGGDGTISTVARIIAGTGMALGVIPFGTFNNFARDAGLRIDINEAVGVLLQGIQKILMLAKSTAIYLLTTLR